MVGIKVSIVLAHFNVAILDNQAGEGHLVSFKGGTLHSLVMEGYIHVEGMFRGRADQPRTPTLFRRLTLHFGAFDANLQIPHNGFFQQHSMGQRKPVFEKDRQSKVVTQSNGMRQQLRLMIATFYSSALTLHAPHKLG